MASEQCKVWLVPCATADAKDVKKRVVHPFWMLRTTTEKSAANMEIFPKNHETRKLDLDGTSWRIPVAKNTQVINAGDVLVLYRPAAATAAPESLVPEPAAKRARN